MWRNDRLRIAEDENKLVGNPEELVRAIADEASNQLGIKVEVAASARDVGI